MLVLSRKLNESIIISEELCERLAAEESLAPAARQGLGEGLASRQPA